MLSKQSTLYSLCLIIIAFVINFSAVRSRVVYLSPKFVPPANTVNADSYNEHQIEDFSSVIAPVTAYGNSRNELLDLEVHSFTLKNRRKRQHDSSITSQSGKYSDLVSPFFLFKNACLDPNNRLCSQHISTSANQALTLTTPLRVFSMNIITLYHLTSIKVVQILTHSLRHRLYLVIK